VYIFIYYLKILKINFKIFKNSIKLLPFPIIETITRLIASSLNIRLKPLESLHAVKSIVKVHDNLTLRSMYPLKTAMFKSDEKYVRLRYVGDETVRTIE